MRKIPGLASLVALIALVAPVLAWAQPVYEMRAVWLTTTLGLDWPAGVSGAAEQEAALRAIIRRSADQNLNTVYFQVVSRGDAMFESERLPWSPMLTGQAGRDPGFDPLAVAIDEAHRNGLEIHAWFNVYRIQPMATPSPGPDHVSELHPEWTEKDGEWLNPGYPGVTDWLIENVTEIVAKYEIDGMHFDFARYDLGGYLRDDSLFAANNPNGIAAKNDWRRENVTSFMRDVFSAITALKPWVKVGSTPIGNFDETCINTAFTGYEGVFQDSRRWLAEGHNDYLAPQIYWADGDPTTRGLYSCLVDDWVSKKGTSRDIFAGIALYRDVVQAEIGSQIDISRSDGANGVVFFREEHTRGENFAGRFDLPALRTPTLRFEAAAPTTPESLSLFVDPSARVVNLDWLPSSGTDDDPVGWYLVLRASGEAPDIQNSEHHRAVIFADRRSLSDTLSASETGPFSYAVVAFGRLGVESEPSAVLTTDLIPVAVESDAPSSFELGFAYPNPARARVTVTIIGAEQASLTARVLDQTGRVVWHNRTGIQPDQPLVIDTGSLAAGVYHLEIASGERRSVRTFVLVR